MDHSVKSTALIPALCVVGALGLILCASFMPDSPGDIGEAVIEGDEDTVRRLARRGLDSEVVGEQAYSPLHLAAYSGNVEAARLLIAEGADVNDAVPTGVAPLHCAATAGELEIATLLLEAGADVNGTTSRGLTPLHCAASGGHTPVVELLIARGADLHARTESGATVLHYAVLSDPECLATLLEHGAEVNARDRGRVTPLGRANRFGRTGAAGLLRNHGATE